MEPLKKRLKFASGGDATLLVWTPPQNFIKSVVAPACYALPILQRAGGFLAAVPNDFLSDELLIDSAADGHEGTLGPSKVFEALLMEEDEQNNVVTTDYVNSFLVVDILDAALLEMHEFDPTTDDAEAIVPFEDTMPSAIPKVSDSVAKILERVDTAVTGRAHFYSAREEPIQVATPKRGGGPKKVSNAVLVEQMNALAAQVQLLAEMQKQNMVGNASPSATLAPDPSGGTQMVSRLPGLANGLGVCQTPGKAVQLVGPPPKTKAAERERKGVGLVEDEPRAIEEISPQDPILSALSSQSTALTALVAHLAGGGDVLQDLGSSSSGQGSLSSRGVARREKMQNELAGRTSMYFMQVQQQIFKRMNPAKQVPQTLEELVSANNSMTAYLERYGGYKSARDAGLALWVAAHAMDCASVGDFAGTKEYLALLCAALEQSALDGSWNLAWVLTLMDDPPAMLFADRMQPVVAHGRPFAPIVPPTWAATSLAYLREIEVLVTRKNEVKPAKSPNPKGRGETDTENPSPRRKQKFPKKPKDGAEREAK